MSRAAPCGGCLAGRHERHERDWNIRPGFLGGEFCDCPGDCAEAFAASVEKWAALLPVAPTPCPTCNGAGIVDTSPPGVEHTAPWLLTDTDCARCDGTGEIDPTTYEPDIEESP